jgi:Ca-activated chloride channel homolog
MFRFQNEIYLYALLGLPILVGIFALGWSMRLRAMRKFGELALVQKLAPGYSRARHVLKFGLLLVALTALVIAWANPQWSGKRQQVKRKGIDMVIALDISQSMLAQDITPNRLERAKRFAQNLVDELGGNNIGVVLFACNGFLATPLTIDYNFAKLSLATANPDQAASQGTGLGEAITVAQRAFKAEEKQHHAIVLISDGEDHTGEAAAQATQAREQGTLVFTVGVGREEGAFVPTVRRGRNDYLRDQTGNPVRSSLDASTLQEIAIAGGGAYFNLNNDTRQLVTSLRERLDAIEKREFETRMFTDYESYFQYFVAIGLLLIMIEFLLPYKVMRKQRAA